MGGLLFRPTMYAVDVMLRATATKNGRLEGDSVESFDCRTGIKDFVSWRARQITRRLRRIRRRMRVVGRKNSCPNVVLAVLANQSTHNSSERILKSHTSLTSRRLHRQISGRAPTRQNSFFFHRITKLTVTGAL